ncbi:MAG: GDSL-type esterase/lipase family protein [Dehalococcoidia bacterium]
MNLPAHLLLPLVAVVVSCFLVACTGREAAPAAITRPPVLVAIGASDSVGVGASDPARTGWVPQLHQKLPPDTRLINLGISGAKVADALSQELPVALDVDPDDVVVWIAVNDLLGETPLPDYERDLDLLLGALTGRTRARVYVANVPNLGALPNAPGLAASSGINPARIARAVGEWNDVIARVVARHNATLVDLSAGWQELAENPGYISADGFHPSDDGYARLADLFWGVMQASGQPSSR